MPRRRILPLTIIRTGPHTFELRAGGEVVLETHESIIRVRERVAALELVCGPGERLAVRLLGIRPDQWRRPRAIYG